ncbi:RHS repeat-associated core domain-containing protein [Chryseobacterium wangxinyae]|uniref:RHS repeat domain-containing protein n=1 Tax=Chryseobacterium sp. CY350 TaxID=2997336 RepID=UPI0022FD3DA9|nr:RHS repeat-associated core domain-containing protein [Chryseobacterium sp. CY350]WBZ96431.1 RHS repeat-associated core domain-containing protein [Chryseobacterium sp. CY350]
MSYADSNHDGGILPRDMNSKYCEDMGDGNMACYDYWMPGEVVEVNNYYPFGLMHNYTATTMNRYQYKYNGKELQETGMYDYGARFYMPDIGRWGVVDPLAEKYRRQSTYNYTVNNPIRFIDPDGRGVEYFGKEAEKKAQPLEKTLVNKINELQKGNASDKGDRIAELNKSKSDISDMRNDKTTEYKFDKAGGKSDGNSINEHIIQDRLAMEK